MLVHFTDGWAQGAQRPPTVPINLGYLRIDFIQPGARPAALGGAFIGAAQDATAAAINPAGLTYLRGAGAAAHQRVARTKFKEPDGPDLNSNFHSDIFDQNLVISFLQIKKITLALYRQAAFDARYNFDTKQFLTSAPNTTRRFVLGGLGNFPGRVVDLDLELVHNGFAVGFALAKTLRIGVASKLSVLNFKLHEQTFLDPEVLNGIQPRGNVAESLYSITTVDNRKTKSSFSVGLMGNVVLDQLFLGAVVNLNPTYRLRSNIHLPEYTVGTNTLDRELQINQKENDFQLSVPDSYGFGLYYYIASRRLGFAFDLLRIEYSDLLNGNNPNVVADDPTDDFVDPDGEDDLTIEDATELHFGIEWTHNVPKLGQIPFRFGLRTDPAHRIHSANNDSNMQKLFPEAKTRLHVAFGLGLSLPSNIKFDGSVDLSEDGYELIGSFSFLTETPFK